VLYLKVFVHFSVAKKEPKNAPEIIPALPAGTRTRYFDFLTLHSVTAIKLNPEHKLKEL